MFKLSELDSVRRAAIVRGAANDIELTPADFILIDGEWCIDGMSPDEWIDAMLMD